MVLTEACFYGDTILRITFLENLITDHYPKMNKDQRKGFWTFLDGIRKTTIQIRK
jgi:hypothetical protein